MLGKVNVPNMIKIVSFCGHFNLLEAFPKLYHDFYRYISLYENKKDFVDDDPRFESYTKYFEKQKGTEKFHNLKFFFNLTNMCLAKIYGKLLMMPTYEQVNFKVRSFVAKKKVKKVFVIFNGCTRIIKHNNIYEIALPYESKKIEIQKPSGTPQYKPVFFPERNPKIRYLFSVYKYLVKKAIKHNFIIFGDAALAMFNVYYKISKGYMFTRYVEIAFENKNDERKFLKGRHLMKFSFEGEYKITPKATRLGPFILLVYSYPDYTFHIDHENIKFRKLSWSPQKYFDESPIDVVFSAHAQTSFIKFIPADNPNFNEVNNMYRSMGYKIYDRVIK